MNESTLRTLLVLLATDDPRAIVEVRALANKLYALAESLEAKQLAKQQQDNGFQAPSGFSDRVRMRVNKPDGTSETTDTGETK